MDRPFRVEIRWSPLRKWGLAGGKYATRKEAEYSLHFRTPPNARWAEYRVVEEGHERG